MIQLRTQNGNQGVRVSPIGRRRGGEKTQPVVFGRGDLMQSLDSKRLGLGGGVGRRDPYRR